MAVITVSPSCGPPWEAARRRQGWGAAPVGPYWATAPSRHGVHCEIVPDGQPATDAFGDVAADSRWLISVS